MPNNYSADIDAILKSSKHVADAVRNCDEMPSRFLDGCAGYDGWWGEEGGFDEFATEMGPQVRQEQEQVVTTLRSITTGFLALVDAVGTEAGNVQRPQLQALDDIGSQGSEGGSRR